MNIVLIGYRGTGKSSVGKILAMRMGKDYVGMDSEIVRETGMEIPEIVEKSGWPGFRDLESHLALKLSLKDDLLIDTGGGIVERPENLEALGKNARIIWLKASVGVIVARIEGDTRRPALIAGKTFTQEVGEVLSNREPKYESAAHHSVDTDTLTPEQVADRILELLQEED
jgi:shikimate kinase